MTEQQTTHAPTFNEAPASWNVRYLTSDGYDCQLTLRDMVAADLVKRIPACLDWLRENGAQPTRVSAPTFTPATTPPPPAGPVLVPAGQEFEEAQVAEETIEIRTLAHAVTENGKPFIKVKGGKYSKFGVKAWPDNLPEALQGYESWEIGKEYQPPAGIKHAVVQDGKKVTKFLP